MVNPEDNPINVFLQPRRVAEKVTKRTVVSTKRSHASICKFLPQIETKPIECVLKDEVNLKLQYCRLPLLSTSSSTYIDTAHHHK